MKSIRMFVLAAGVASFFGAATLPVLAQDLAPAPVGGELVAADGAEAPPQKAGFFRVIKEAGFLGGFLWTMIFLAAAAAVWFSVDNAITVRPIRIMPDILVSNVTEAMQEGDVIKALQCCENEPGPLANILTSGFSHVEEGFDVIEEAIGTAAELESEMIMQKLTWLSVVGNLAPMLGLLGTVQGMIAAFGRLGTGAPNVGLLAMDISQALYTTAAGLLIAVPCVAVYYIFRNSANKIILRMEALTMELIGDLRNVEVVEE
jgi:biopolymer transport protein ExbB